MFHDNDMTFLDKKVVTTFHNSGNPSHSSLISNDGDNDDYDDDGKNLPSIVMSGAVRVCEKVELRYAGYRLPSDF